MKKDLHPSVSAVDVKCTGCGNAFVITSAYNKGTLNVEFCAKCHPAYTGKRKIATQGAIERLKKRYGDIPLTSTGMEKKDND